MCGPSERMTRMAPVVLGVDKEAALTRGCAEPEGRATPDKLRSYAAAALSSSGEEEEREETKRRPESAGEEEEGETKRRPDDLEAETLAEVEDALRDFSVVDVAEIEVPPRSDSRDLTMPSISGASRTVLLYNVPPTTPDAEVYEWAGRYGAVRALDSSGRMLAGCVSVSYFDLRHSVLAAEGFAGRGPQPCPSHFQVAFSSVPPTAADGIALHDSLSLTGLTLVGREELLLKLKAFGDLHVVTGPKSFQYGEQCSVEYYDLRDSQKALENLWSFGVLGEMVSVVPVLSAVQQQGVYSQARAQAFWMGGPADFWVGSTPSVSALTAAYGPPAASALARGWGGHHGKKGTGRGGAHRRGEGRRQHKADPHFAFDVEEAATGGKLARTTVMIKNIPNKYSQRMLLQVLEATYGGQYDFFYLPIDFKNKANLGYGFVNFKTSEAALAFFREFHKKRWSDFNSKKVCEITYARVQGKDALVEHFKNSKFPCDDPDCLPLIL